MDITLCTTTSTGLDESGPHGSATSSSMPASAGGSENHAVPATLVIGEEVSPSEIRKPSVGNPASIIPAVEEEHPLRVMSLHALLYCERLFYLEEVEEIRVADAAVYAGRRLHDDLQPLDDESPETRRCDVASEHWGLLGVVDAVRRRDGHWVAYEHKRGRCRRDDDNKPQAWPSDRIQAFAYAVLLEESLGEAVPQARIRYHADNVTVCLEIDQAARDDLSTAIARARVLRRTTLRPPVTTIEALCKRCSLAPVCLPEEERLVETDVTRVVPTLFPSNRERTTLHVVSPKAYISRSGDRLTVSIEGEKQTVPIQDIDSVVIHGFGQMTTQAIHLCSYHGIGVQWMTAGGKFSAGTTASPGRVQQRIRQYAALSQPATCIDLTRHLVHAKVETQLRYILRVTRGDNATRSTCQRNIDLMREALSKVHHATSLDSLRGLEGIAAKSYFACLATVLSPQVPEELRPHGRTKHPPRDRFNALLSFGYALIHSAVHRSLISIGLEPALGFFHQPRTSAPPLVMDLMEIFRTPVWEMPLIGSVNRGQWNVNDDFDIRPGQVWLSETGRKKAVELFEHRLEESYKHPHTGQSLSYARIIELEARLLEKEWSGCPGHFARMRIR